MVSGMEADISAIAEGTDDLSGETVDFAEDEESYALTSADGEFGLTNVMTLRARLGYDVDGTWMPFITGGLAWGKVNTRGTAEYELYDAAGDYTYTKTSRFGDNEYEMGWTLGAGLNYRVADNAFLGLTYLYTDLGKHDISDSYRVELKNGELVGEVDGEVDARFHTVRLSFDVMF